MSTVRASAFVLAALCGASVGLGDVGGESIGGYAGALTVDLQSGTRGVAIDVYNNHPSASNFGLSSTDLTSIWGDELTTTGTGTLQEFGLTIFNSGSSAGPLVTADVAINFFRISDSSLIGGFTGTLDFGAGLNPGFFSRVTFTGLDGLGIDLDTTNILVTQQRTDHTGTASRLGIASLMPILVGSSPDDMYVDSDTVGGGVPGFYNFTVAGAPAPANPGYRVAVPTPASMALLGLGGLFAARRRRA